MGRVDGESEALFEGIPGTSCPADETRRNFESTGTRTGVDRTCLYAWKRKLGRGPSHHGRTTLADWRELQRRIAYLCAFGDGLRAKLPFGERRL